MEEKRFKMSFEHRLDLSHYNSYLKDIIELLSKNPMKRSQLATVRKLQIMILNKEITPHDNARCEEILQKIKCVCEKVHEIKMIPVYERLEQFKPFLTNLLKKYDNIEKNSKLEKEHKYVKSLYLILERRKLNIHNADRCEAILQQMLLKVEKNTITAITAKAEIDPGNQSSKTVDDILINHSKAFDDSKVVKNTEATDPRITRGKLINKPKIRGMYLERFENYTHLSTKEDRLAYKLKSMIKPKSMPESERIHLYMQNSSVFPPNQGIPQMVPPPNIAQNSYAYMDSTNINQHLISATSTVLSNMQMPAIQSQAKVSQNDPRLKSRAGSNLSTVLPLSAQHLPMTNKYSMPPPPINPIMIEPEKLLLDRIPSRTSLIPTTTLQGESKIFDKPYNSSTVTPSQDSLATQEFKSNYLNTDKVKDPSKAQKELSIKATSTKKNEASTNPEEVLKMIGNVYGEDTVTAFAQFVAMKAGKEDKTLENKVTCTKDDANNYGVDEKKVDAKVSRAKKVPYTDSKKTKTVSKLDPEKTENSASKRSHKKLGFLEDVSLNEECKINISNNSTKKKDSPQKTRNKKVDATDQKQSQTNKKKSTSLNIDKKKPLQIEKKVEKQTLPQQKKNIESPKKKPLPENLADSVTIFQENKESNIVDESKVIEKPVVKKKRGKTELEKLNIDINEMFIRDGVLNANGRRNVPVKTYNEDTTNTRRQSNSKNEVAEKKISNSTIHKFNLKPCSVMLTRLELIKDKESSQFLQQKFKNINPTIHLQSEYRNKCIICNVHVKKNETITSHYIDKHQCKEIYTSRLKPSFANVVISFPHFKEGTLEGTKFSPRTRITATCKFCLEKMSLIGKNWKIHLMQHTGEFRCKGCDVKHGDPSWNKNFVNKYPHKEYCVNRNFITEDIQFDKGVLMAYMCKLCNFVQLQKNNISKHLTMEHEDLNECNVHDFEIINYKCDENITEEQNQMPQLIPIGAPSPPLSSPTLHTDHTYSKEKISLNDKGSQHLSENRICNNRSDATTLYHTNPLKVWVNKPSEKSKKNILDSLSDVRILYSFYKCMAECIFCTDNEDEAINHYSSHEDSSFECPYCDHNFGSSKELMDHMKIHEASIYQCSYCFYRSCAAFNVVIHQNHYHPSMEVKILLCKGKNQQIPDEMNLINSCREKYVPPLLCTICNKKWFIFNLFEDHLLTHSQKKMRCQACKSELDRGDLLKHLHTHRIGLFECVYCFYGTNEMESMRLHMSTIHPTRLLYVVARQCKKGVKPENVDEHSIDSTVLAHIGACVDKSLIHSFSLPSIKLESDSLDCP